MMDGDPRLFVRGFGGVGFGQAIKRMGVALGTSVVMGIIVVIGTALPAVTSNLSATQAVGTAVGVLLGILGFVMGSKAGLLREAGEAGKQQREQQEKYAPAAADENKSSSSSSSSLQDLGGGGKGDGEGVGEDGGETGGDVEGGGRGEGGGGKGGSSSSTAGGGGGGFFESMMWCLVGGVLSSMLQFAFVFGGNLVTLAEEAGVPKTAAAMPIWLLCFIFNAAREGEGGLYDSSWSSHTRHIFLSQIEKFVHCILS